MYGPFQDLSDAGIQQVSDFASKAENMDMSPSAGPL
jgi:hypothetical protein